MGELGEGLLHGTIGVRIGQVRRLAKGESLARPCNSVQFCVEFIELL